MICEGRRLVAPEAVALTRGLVSAWLLDLADCSSSTLCSFIDQYRALRDDDADASAAITQLAERVYPLGSFSGHLETGSRALDSWQAAQI